jgi:MFS family permease
MLVITAWLFDRHVLNAETQTIAWMVIFFFASAGASAAYLTVSEIFPMETRALAIAFFYAVGTGLGGIIGPVLFGNLIATDRSSDVAVGYLIGGVLMVGAGLVEVLLGVDAEQKSLEDIATPLSAVDSGEPGAAVNEKPDSQSRETAAPPLPRRRTGSISWAPIPQASTYPRTNPYLAREVDALVDALDAKGPLSSTELQSAVAGRYWGPGRFRAAVLSGTASGRIRRVTHGRFAAGHAFEPRDGTEP